MPQFKWRHFAYTLFKLQFGCFLVHLLVVCVSAYSIAGHYRGDRFPACSAGSVLCYVLASVFSIVGLVSSARQLLVDGHATFFRKFFKIVDLLADAFQLLAGFGVAYSIMVYDKPRSAWHGSALGWFARFTNSWSVLFFFLKLLGFARGFPSFASLVRMILKIINDIGNFIGVLTMILMGFSMAFMSLGDNHLRSTYWVYSSTISGSDVETDVDPASHSTFFSYTLLFQVLMFVVSIICLNLLIAIMSSTYEKVNSVAEQEALHELTSIILDIERFILPMFIKWFSIPFEILFPRWLHLLVPRHAEDRVMVV